MSIYRAVHGRQTTEAGTREGWYVERLDSEPADDSDPPQESQIVSTLYNTKSEAEAEAKRLQKAEEEDA